MQSFEQMIAKISTNLDRKLPGTSAHKKLQPYYPSAKNLSIPTNPFAKKSAVLVLLFPKNNQINVVFIERPANTGVHSKQIAFPGGKVEKADTSYLDTALRETKEETNIDIIEAEVLGFSNNLLLEKYEGDQWLTVYVRVTEWKGEPMIMEKEKCESWDWYDLADIPQPLFEATRLCLNILETGSFFTTSKKTKE